jgi:sulfatase maturation enzyme AslB (radical SAM superfamily)
LALDYRCNLRCIGCHSCNDTGERLASSQAASLLRWGRERGIDQLWLGGGEPTLREDLLALVREARRVGYREIVLQTNGMRLAYPKYRHAVLEAGITEVRFNVKSHREELHDRLSGGEKCHALLLQAIDGLAGTAVRMTADVLVTASTARELPELVSFYASRRVQAFVLWLLSAWDSRETTVASEVPRIASLWSALASAREQAEHSGATLSSLHTPPCSLPPALRCLFSPASALGLVVVGPDGRPFSLEDSPFEGGAYTAACSQCVHRPSCGGPRPDYIRIHGDSEFVPILAGEPSVKAVSA